ncbi:hypothetical protein FC40_GL000635 [Ligilactobacillus hayakitensis DSM 18933 = JCM 14209]|uniref:DUF2969 domain-containing protein n=1 Tax=Ligilactobacillus hayakitensis DSM 18933 = JCM 14209 TaxID=1423755 RepID=A0A0R1WLY4_9LACO|nr:DUF2969 domain-containing protein [Ligilactobacillus hayakitensis]KRM18850.1 hypothetical protein FC40_GL000635 [Ligilactobacillus hayakitensis DSM 18933 = JCM 14209]
MSKKEKTIEIHENEKVINGVKVHQLTTKNDEVIGEVKPEGSKFIAALSSGEKFTVTRVEEGMAILLREYHLHYNN